MEPTTSFFDQLPNEIISPIIEMAARSGLDEIAISQVSHSFKEKLPAIPPPHVCGYYAREQKVVMGSIFFDKLKFACQKVDNRRAHHPQPPRITMSKWAETLPVCESLIITDVDLEVPLRCDVSKVHTLLFGLTDKQYKYELFNKFSRVVKFFTINKFPSLKCLVLNNVNLTDELLKCFQEYNLEFFYVWYFSLNNNFDEKYVNLKTHLKEFKTLSVKEFRIDTSVKFMFPSIRIEIPQLEILILNINPLGSNPYENTKGEITFDASMSEDLPIVKIDCCNSFDGTATIIPPIMRGGVVKEVAIHAFPRQIIFRAGTNSSWQWGHRVVKLCMPLNMIEDTGTTFPNCRVHTTCYTDGKTFPAECICNFGRLR